MFFIILISLIFYRFPVKLFNIPGNDGLEEEHISPKWTDR